MQAQAEQVEQDIRQGQIIKYSRGSLSKAGSFPVLRRGCLVRCSFLLKIAQLGNPCAPKLHHTWTRVKQR
jgi:cystathionine beta-lyase family protein involved in aluminum resistance